MKLNRTAVLGFIGVAVGLVCSIYTAIKATPKAEQLKKEAKGNPFIAVFTFGEYGVKDHGANTTGGLMLSFTAFGK